MATIDRRGATVSAADPPIATNPNPDLAIKAPVLVATTGANIVLSGLQTIDGVALAAGNRVLVKDQTDQTTNGIYNASTGVWTRAIDLATNDQVAAGTQVLVWGGATLAGTIFEVASADPITLGTSLLTFRALATAAAIASQADAVAGTRNDVLMSPLRTAEVIAAVVPPIATNAQALAGTSNSVLMTPLATAEYLASQAITNFQQTGSTTTVSVVQILKEWFTLQMFGGIGDGNPANAAVNAAAFAQARDALLLGGELTIPPGLYYCNPVNFVRPDVNNGYMTIKGVANPSGGLGTNCAIYYTGGAGSGTFWNFDSPAAPSASNGVGWSVEGLYIYATNAGYDGSLISSSTPVTDGSKISFYFNLENCDLGQAGAGSCILLNIGKAIEVTVYRNHFQGGLTQIMGQQGLTVAGTAQSRQSTTVDIRKNEFIGCNGFAILYGGEGWGLYDNIFEASAGGRMRVFATNSNYPVLNMSWINNWIGDNTVAGDEGIVLYGSGLVFQGNVCDGAWSGSGAGSIPLALYNGFNGFAIAGNSFRFSNIGINAYTSPDGGFIKGNTYTSGGSMTSGTFGVNTDVGQNVVGPA